MQCPSKSNDRASSAQQAIMNRWLNGNTLKYVQIRLLNENKITGNLYSATKPRDDYQKTLHWKGIDA
jgi:hypothetical protein